MKLSHRWIFIGPGPGHCNCRSSSDLPPRATNAVRVRQSLICGSSRLLGYDAVYIGTRKVLDKFLVGVMQVLSTRSFYRCFRKLVRPPFNLVSHLAGLGSKGQENEAALPEEWSCLIGNWDRCDNQILFTCTSLEMRNVDAARLVLFHFICCKDWDPRQSGRNLSA